MNKKIEYLAAHGAGYAVALALIDNETLSYNQVRDIIKQNFKNSITN